MREPLNPGNGKADAGAGAGVCGDRRKQKLHICNGQMICTRTNSTITSCICGVWPVHCKSGIFRTISKDFQFDGDKFLAFRKVLRADNFLPKNSNYTMYANKYLCWTTEGHLSDLKSVLYTKFWSTVLAIGLIPVPPGHTNTHYSFVSAVNRFVWWSFRRRRRRLCYFQFVAF